MAAFRFLKKKSVEMEENKMGTGDTLTDVATAPIATGIDIREASMTASKVNRLAGVYAHPTKLIKRS